MDVRHFTFLRRSGDPKPYQHARVSAGRLRSAVDVEVTESPNRRTVYVHVNGKQVHP